MTLLSYVSDYFFSVSFADFEYSILLLNFGHFSFLSSSLPFNFHIYPVLIPSTSVASFITYVLIAADYFS